MNGATPRTASASPGPRSSRVMTGLFGGGWAGFNPGNVSHTTAERPGHVFERLALPAVAGRS